MDLEPVQPEADFPEDSIRVLDTGYIKFVDVMGKDEDIAAAARISYGKGTTKAKNDDGLIEYLYSHAHTSPFEMVEMKFQMRLPIFVMRQLVRHRTANLNEYSGRYSEMPDRWYVPSIDQIRRQHATNKQASGEPLTQAEALIARNIINSTSERAFDQYHHLLSMGVSRETARIVLPLNTYTEIVWKMDMNNLLKFLILRDDPHSQWEIQQYAQIISSFVMEYFPATYSAYMKRKQAITLTQDELMALVTGDYSRLRKSQKERVQNLQRDLQQKITAEMAKENQAIQDD